MQDEDRITELEARVANLEWCVSSQRVNSTSIFRSKAIRLKPEDSKITRHCIDGRHSVTIIVRGDLCSYGLFQANGAVIFNNDVYRIIETTAVPGEELNKGIALLVEKRLSNV